MFEEDSLMKIDVKKLDKIRRVLKIELSGEGFVKERNDAYVEIGKSLKVSGFRPGAAPLVILEKQHGNVLRDEFLNRHLPAYYNKAIEEQKLIPAGMPRIYDVKFTDDGLVFFAELEVRPDIELTDDTYKGIKVKDKKIEIKPEEIEKILTNLKGGVKKVTEKDLDDATLAKWACYPDVETLKEAIKTELFAQKNQERRKKINDQVIKHLIKEVKVELPKSEVERHHKQLIEREIYNLQSRGVSETEIEKYKKDLEEKTKPVAEDEVRLFYVLDAIARRENIKAEDNLVDVVLGFILSLAKYEL
jgi:FKBP-type peptidyl-prolyl cis-trans isomerase (trigger factor)